MSVRLSPSRLAHRALLALALIGTLALGGCAVGPDRRDPLEPFNRGVMRFNDELDNAVVKPVATAYRDVVPAPVRTSVNNFFGNLSDVWSLVNSAAQFKLRDATESLMRVSVNTVFGLYGVLDLASEIGLERHREDFGQTLGHYGVPTGPYLVLPLLGPSTLRDAAALITVDLRADPLQQIDPADTRGALVGLRIIDARANFLRASSVVDMVSFDRYTFVRDAHLQRRRAEVFEGEPPEIPEEPKE